MNSNDLELRQADEAARKIARSEFRHPVVLEAGAGTGKTATLVARILVWALGPGWLAKSDEHADLDQEQTAAKVLDGIVAITFTDKASVEMSQRLARATMQIIKSETVIGIDSEDLPDPARAQSRARAILAQMDRIHIETIHAFCRRTLSENALAAGIYPAFRLDADQTLVANVVRDVLSKWTKENLGATLNQDAATLVKAGIGPTAIEEIATLLVNACVPLRVLESDPYPDSVCQKTAQSLQTAIQQLVDFAKPALCAGEKKSLDKAKDCLESLEAISGRLGSVGNVDDLMAILVDIDLTGTHGRMAQWAKKGGNVGESKALLAAGCDTDQFQSLARSLEPRLRATDSWNPEILRASFPILATVIREVHQDLKRRGILTFNDLLRKCRDLLQENPDVVSKLRRSIDQLLVDEVQDTDPLQYDIVRSLAFGDAPRPNLFVVGDPKQTIYGFRRADLGAYADFIQEIKEDCGEVHALSVNFRSTPAILKEVERIVAPVMQEAQGLQPRFERLLCSQHKQNEKYDDGHDGRSVEYWNSWARVAPSVREQNNLGPKTKAGRAREIEGAAIAKEIQALHEKGNYPYSSFAILMKATTQQEVYLSALRNLGIPYLVEKDKQFFKRREVIDATSALTTILDPLDQVALVGWLRSSTVGLPDAALLPLWSRFFPGKVSLLSHPSDTVLAELETIIDEASQEKIDNAKEVERLPLWPTLLKKAVHDLAVLRSSYHHDSVDLFIHKLRRYFPIAVQESARFLGSHRLANLNRFYDQCLEILSRPELSRGRALRLLRAGVTDAQDMEEASPGDETSDAVRVMSIHKAKGLDFKQVFFVALHQGPGGGMNRDAILQKGDRWEFNIWGATTPHFGEFFEHNKKVAAA